MAGHNGVRFLVLMSLLLILHNACVCLCRNRSSSSTCFEDERDALLHLKQSFSNTSHIVSSWKGEDCCQWDGVRCDRANGHVIMLQITNAFEDIPPTAGYLNSSLLNLRYLSHLEMSGIIFENANALKFVGSMKQLRYLNLSYSYGFATIPREWGNLTGLEVLDLHFLRGSGYYFKVAVEDIRWVSHLQALKYLDISYNYFQNSIPSNMFQNMTCLRYLDLSSNMFNGSIPNTIFQNMTSLRHLDLSYNSFAVLIPVTIFQNMTSLQYLALSGIFGEITSSQYLDLSESCFKGLIPTSLHHLDLSLNSFEGPIPSTIFQNMTSLRYLDLSYNDFNSTVPRWLDNLRGLVDLNLEGNRLHTVEGGLFSFLKNKPFLESLSLGFNELQGEIFSVEGNSSSLIGKNLEILEIYNNSLGGALSDWLMNLEKLRILDLSDNQLRGTIPSSYGGWLCLEWLDLSYNQLTGDIPEAFGGFPVLSFLHLNNNLLSGTIPHSLGQLQDLSDLDLSSNSLRGTLSEIHFSRLSKLSRFDISNNYLALQVDSHWIPPFNLRYIRMTSCEIGEDFPQWIRTQINAWEVDLSNASIRGALPNWLGLMSFRYLNLSQNQINGSLPTFPSGLSKLDLSQNQISGSLPTFPSGLLELDLSYNRINGSLPKFPSKLEWLDLSHNLISGPIPQDIHLAMPLLSSLYLNDNHLSGPIPTSFCEMDLYELHLGRNELVGKIPACWKENNYMGLLDLSSNELSGVIPSSLGNLTTLVSIHLNNNSLHEEIPVTMNNCRNLVILDLGENEITGSIPHWFGQSFQFLLILRLRDNMFSGSIPSQLCSLSRLHILDLAVNSLTGIIPNCLGYMKSMKLMQSIEEKNSTHVADMIGNMTTTEQNQVHVEQVVKGIYLDYTTLDLQLMVNLDLSSNKIVGPIPKELTMLSGLRGLNLSRNFLSGGIPTMIGDMKSLESLDLSHNHLQGTIPQSFSAFTSLSKLNLSHNNLTGPIPKGSQIQTLDDPSIYADNPLLCGDPLQKKCPSAKAPKAPKEDSDDDEGKLEKLMFYIVIMLGFAIGFWGVIGVLMYKRNWRRVYFSYVDQKADMVYVIVAVKVAQWRRKLRGE